MAYIDPMWSTMGPPGKDGIDGRPGKDAVQPRDGKDGTDAAFLNLRGTWNRVATYEPLDVVTLDGSSYIATQPNNRKRPHARSSVWQLLAAKGDRGLPGEAGVSSFGRGRQGPPGETVIVEVPSGSNSVLDIVFASDIVAGQAVYITPSGQAELALANSESTTGAVGFAFADGTANTVGQILTEGQVSLADWSVIAGSTNLVPGTVYYLDSNTAGSITSIAPTASGYFVAVVGRAIGLNTLDIELSMCVLLSGNTSQGTGGNSPLQATFDSDAVIGQPVFVSSSGHVDLAIANSAPETDVIGFAASDVLAGAIGSFFSDGTIVRTDWTAVAGTASLVGGDCYFLSDVTAGGITNNPTESVGSYVTQIGRAVSGTELQVSLEPPLLLTGNQTIGGSADFTTELFTVNAVQEANGEFQLAGDVPEGSEFVFINGVLQSDYTITGSPSLLAFPVGCIAVDDLVVIKF